MQGREVKGAGGGAIGTKEDLKHFMRTFSTGGGGGRSLAAMAKVGG